MLLRLPLFLLVLVPVPVPVLVLLPLRVVVVMWSLLPSLLLVFLLWSLRQPLQTPNSTQSQVCKGKLWTSTLTEPLQLLTYFKNGNAASGGSSQALACHWPGMPTEQEPVRQWCADLGSEGPAGPGNVTVHSLETTTARA